MVNSISKSTLAGVDSGIVIVIGIVLRLPAPSKIGLLEKVTKIPGSEVMLSFKINLCDK